MTEGLAGEVRYVAIHHPSPPTSARSKAPFGDHARKLPKQPTVGPACEFRR